MLSLDRLEQCFEVSCTETLMVSSLDHLEEEGWSVFEWLGEDLEEVAFLVVVDEDLLFLEDVDVFGDFNGHLGDVLSDIVIVGVWDFIEEFDTTLLHSGDGLDDVLRAHGDVLDADSSIVVTELLDLTLALAVGWLVDWHLDLLIEVGDDDGLEG